MEMEIPQKFYKLSSVPWLQNYDYFYYMCIALESFIESTSQNNIYNLECA